MSGFIWWIGAVHLALYALAGSVALSAVVLEWTLKKFGVHRAIIAFLFARAKAKFEKDRIVG